ncbi:MAG TPA: hypothetical protein VF334_18645 [Polyangia bacterium]
MVHGISAALGLYFAALFAAGLVRPMGTAWLAWIVGAAGALLLGAAAIDREQASHVQRAQALVLVAVALAAALLIGWHSPATARWFIAAGAGGAAIALISGVATLALP